MQDTIPGQYLPPEPVQGSWQCMAPKPKQLASSVCQGNKQPPGPASLEGGVGEWW